MFEWDARKAASNDAKHGVSFEEARTAFSDPRGMDGEDIMHSSSEPRRLRLAKAASGRVLAIAYVVRRANDAEKTRIISARPANTKEKRRYEAKD